MTRLPRGIKFPKEDNKPGDIFITIGKDGKTLVFRYMPDGHWQYLREYSYK